jgi:pimeloyl-ACP methyl ester carboxylesterase
MPFKGVSDRTPTKKFLKQDRMANIVLVPGAFHGGWYFDAIAPTLRQHGHNVLALTLTGQEKQRVKSAINLKTHIDEVVGAIVDHDLADVILVGHSYAGLVITGVADTIQPHIKALVYLDALVPQDGQRGWDLLNAFFKAAFLDGVAADGLTIAPPPETDPRVLPQPLACFLQRLNFQGDPFLVKKKAYVYCSEWSETPFRPVYARLQATEGWRTHVARAGHDIVNEAPGFVIDVINSVIESCDE